MAAFDLTRQDTICACSTARGAAAIAVIRVSGPQARSIADRVFRKNKSGPLQTQVAHLGMVESKGGVVDEALCTFFPEGRSYTGESSFELSIHGSDARVSSTLRTLVDAGCRLAEPGEFTLRAVLSGRLDLCAAEAVDDVIAARSDVAARTALRTLHGGLRDAVTPCRTVLIDTLAELEARMDYPDEELGQADRASLDNRLAEGEAALRALLKGAPLGRRLLDGARVVLYGLPNAGKSTLLNALVGQERAIVHDRPGTTRDILEAERVFSGVPCLLVDVAGVRDGAVDEVEAMGIARAQSELQRADLILRVIDGVSEMEPPKENIESTDAPVLDVWTKFDALPACAIAREGAISAKTGARLDILSEAIGQTLRGVDAGSDDVLLTKERQRVEVQRAADAIYEARRALQDRLVDEVVTSELRGAGVALDRLLGLDLNEEVLDTIFSRFCIGK